MNTEITKINDATARGWIFYDAACETCIRGQRLTGRWFESRGFAWLPLQSQGAAARLGVSELAFEIRMHLLLPDGRVFINADALGVLCRSVWWLWPVGALLLVPGFRELGRMLYDWFARNRHRFGGPCNIERTVIPGVPSSIKPRPMGAHIVPLVALPVLVLAFGWDLDAWIFMWALAFALFAGCKWLTHSTALHHGAHPGLRRVLGYLFTWPGMDAAAFYRDDIRAKEPRAVEWLFAGGSVFIGAMLLWFVTGRIAPVNALAGGWIGMVGVVFILHFGLFHILSLAWRSRGVCAAPLMRMPLAATSLGEFWSRRWNTAFHHLARQVSFRPLRRSIGPTFATLAVFILSGWIHELVISVPARGGVGLPTVYFLIQGLGMVGEHTMIGRRMGMGRGLRGRLFTISFTVIPAPLLFHPPFVHNVILPMLKVIGAT